MNITIFGNIPVLKISGTNPELINIRKVPVNIDRRPALYLPNLLPKIIDSVDLDIRPPSIGKIGRILNINNVRFTLLKVVKKSNRKPVSI
jgi:hypothetical protein